MKIKKKKSEQMALPKVEAFPSWAGGSLFDLVDAKMELSPQAYCLRFAVAEDWAALRTVIEERRRATPAFWWWSCPACGFTERRRGDTTEARCLKCGQPMEKLSAGEAAKIQAAEDKRRAELMEKSFRAGLYERNHLRQLEGLAPLTADEFRAERKREAELAYQRSRG